MRHAITSIFKAICSRRAVVAGGKDLVASPMVALNLEEMHEVAGGEEPNLPKGGW
jgi:hypothetical protein